jgi:hypothetical protein
MIEQPKLQQEDSAFITLQGPLLGDASADINAGIHMSINGFAAGLRNSG